MRNLYSIAWGKFDSYHHARSILTRIPCKGRGGKSPQRTIMKNVTISRKQETKGMRGILDLTGRLPQVLKQFEGIYSAKLPETDGLTVEGWMEAHGVSRFVTPKGNKKGYTPALVNAGFNEAMLLKSDDGKVMGTCIYKNVVAKYMREENGGEKAYRVYASEESALSAEGKPISKYQLVQIPDNCWSVRTILRGLIQSAHHDKETEKVSNTAKAWEDVKECWIVVTEDKKLKAIKVSKERVVF